MATVTVSGAGQTYTFSYFEKYGSPVEMCSGDVFRAKRIFDVAYDYRWIFIRYMLGTAELSADGKKINRYLPDQYYVYYAPQFKEQKSFMIATTLEDMEVLGEQKEITDIFEGSLLKNSGYKIARITIGYEAVTYDVLTDNEMGSDTEYSLRRFATVFRQPTAEFLTLPQGAFKWVEFDSEFGNEAIVKLDANKNPVGTRVVGSNGKIISAQEIILVHHKVPGIPRALNTHIGCVNDKAWPSMRAQRGQLLLSNVELKPYRWLAGQRLFDITYKFKFFDPDPAKTLEMVNSGRPERARGHNWFLQYFPNTSNVGTVDPMSQIPQYKLMTHNGRPDDDVVSLRGKTVYAYADMSKLFTDFVDYRKENAW